MGMFDYVEFEMDCPMCGTKVKEFQTQSKRNTLDRLRVGDLGNYDEFYSPCPECGLWIELHKESNNSREAREKIVKEFFGKDD